MDSTQIKRKRDRYYGVAALSLLLNFGILTFTNAETTIMGELTYIGTLFLSYLSAIYFLFAGMRQHKKAGASLTGTSLWPPRAITSGILGVIATLLSGNIFEEEETELLQTASGDQMCGDAGTSYFGFPFNFSHMDSCVERLSQSQMSLAFGADLMFWSGILLIMFLVVEKIFRALSRPTTK